MSNPTRRAIIGAALAGLALPAVAACSGQAAQVGGSTSGGDSSPSAGGEKKVTLALVAGWDEGVAATYLWKQILEDKGFSVTVNELEVAQSYLAVAEGQADLFLGAWLPATQQPYWEKNSDKLEKVSDWFTPATLLLATPNYVSDVNTIADLTGKGGEFGGQIVGIEPGAGLMRLTKEAVIPQYGLTDYTLVESSTPAMLASLEKAIGDQKPIVVTLWKPHWAFTKYPIKVLEDTKGAFGAADNVTAIATKGFATKQADVSGWISKFTMDDQQLGSLELLIQQKGQGQEQAAAAEWIKTNQSLVDSWTA
ncbi:glycine betaine/proline transport system substrate-binding protein [Quadrisphaera granulorum]|uniref:Glycine betaine/proline transport system substrate-binding protein n=1 Tax=Quadrisphaera granulorum TaxID=317664 RepID=A0A315ZTE1_9ACTN|nr:glycine betaine ABC transporter substrate-binding protein [Quadrisphaera granulorum]PWJ48815.1 glycine betaine/proline transport system substrate-binding protein [Quadrisphaera granulorum]SZE98297.1 glycine betaine/proline transport system substrate-binding protein [Quadrisphaera granulorum]